MFANIAIQYLSRLIAAYWGAAPIFVSESFPLLLIAPTNTNIQQHYNDVIMGAIASQITSLTIVYSTVYSGADQRKHESSALMACVQGIRRGPVNSPHKWPVTRKMFLFDDVIMNTIDDVHKRSLLRFR